MRLGGPRCAAGVDSFENPCLMARKMHKGAKGVAGALARAQLARRRRWATSTRCDDARDGHLLRPVVHGRRRARGRPQWSTDGDAPEGVQGIVSGLHEKSDRDQRALLRK